MDVPHPVPATREIGGLVVRWGLGRRRFDGDLSYAICDQEVGAQSLLVAAPVPNPPSNASVPAEVSLTWSITSPSLPWIGALRVELSAEKPIPVTTSLSQ